MDSKKIIDALLEEINRHVMGKNMIVRKVVCAVLAGGHVLIEDIPGLGKTTLAVTLAKAMGLQAKRMQFTPDVLPSDITGFNMYSEGDGNMVFQPGPIFCNIFLADEINRTSPKSQSALLEVMEERKVTVDGVTRPLPEPFMVIATQNPSGAAGTQLLPDSEMDRFMIRLSMGYPEIEDEINIIKSRRNQSTEVNAVLHEDVLLAMMQDISEVYIHDVVYDYIVRLVTATRENEYIKQGGSPRAGIAIAKMAAAWAYMEGRDYVIPKDVENVFSEVMIHRILVSPAAHSARISKEQILEDIAKRVEKPKVVKNR